MSKEAKPTSQKEKRSTSIPVETLFAPMYSDVAHTVRFGLSLAKDFKNIPGTDFPQGSLVTAKGKFSFYASPDGLHVIKNSKPTSISSEPDQLTTALFGDRPTAKDMRGALLFAGEIASMRKQAGVALTPAELIQFKNLLINSWEAPVAEKETILGILEQRIPELGHLSTLPALPLLMGGKTPETNTLVIAQKEAAQKEFQRAFTDMDQPTVAFILPNLTGKVAHEIANHPNFKAPFADVYHTIEAVKVVDGQNPGEYQVTYYGHSDKGWNYPQTIIQLGEVSLTESEAFYANVAEHQTGIAERLITDGRNPDAPYSVPQFVDSQGYPLHQTPEQAFVTSLGERLPKNPNIVGAKEQQRVLSSDIVRGKLQTLQASGHPTDTQVMISPDGKYYQISVTEIDGHADTTKRVTSTFSVAREAIPAAPAEIADVPQVTGSPWKTLSVGSWNGEAYDGSINPDAEVPDYQEENAKPEHNGHHPVKFGRLRRLVPFLR